jgi:purine-binding chemotaxis protein CheW
MAQNESRTFVAFLLDGQRFALPLEAVLRVVRVVELTALPDTPGPVIGAIALSGRIVAVVDLRRLLALPLRDMELTDHLLIANAGARTVALLVDEAMGIFSCPMDEVVPATGLAQGLEQLAGIVRLEDGLVWIQDLEKCLSTEEGRLAELALQRVENHATP